MAHNGKYCIKTKLDLNLKKEAGFTLIEILVATAIVSFITLVASMFLISFVRMNKSATQSEDVNRDLNNAIAMLQNYTFYGVNVRFADEAALGYSGLDSRATGPQGQGLVRNIHIDQASDANLNIKPSTTLMYFWREATYSNPNSAALTSSYTATAVFYRKKNETAVNPEDRPSALILHPGKRPGDTSPLRVSDQNNMIFRNITDVTLDQQQIVGDPALGILASIRITLKAIYPLASITNDMTLTDCYGPSRDIENGVTCQNSRPYRIVQKAAVLIFPNNKRSTSNPNHEFANGIYFFKPAIGVDP